MTRLQEVKEVDNVDMEMEDEVNKQQEVDRAPPSSRSRRQATSGNPGDPHSSSSDEVEKDEEEKKHPGNQRDSRHGAP